MSLRFIMGRAGTGKTEYCLRDIKATIQGEDNSKAILLVPEDYSFQAEKRLLKTVGITGLAKAEVLSFKRMAYKVFAQCGGLTRKHMNTAGKYMLLYNILKRLKGQFEIYGKAAGEQGFIKTMSDMITELKTYGITPEMLKNTLENLQDNEILWSKTHDISLIYEEFEKELHKEYIDSDDDLSMLNDKLNNCTLYDGAEIWVDGFSMLTPQQLMIIKKLLLKARKVNITLCLAIEKGNTDKFYPIENMRDRLLRMAEMTEIKAEEPVVLNNAPFRFMESNSLGHLEKNIYTYPFDRFEEETGDISIFKSVNKYSEVQYAARDIIRLCRDENYRYGDITVVTKDLEGYEKLIGAIFTENSIPYYIDKKRDILSNPIIVLILSAMEILIKNWSYESVFRYLKTYLTGILREDIDIIENYVLSCGIKGKRWVDQKEWDYWPDKGIDEELSEDAKEALAKINIIRYKIICPLLDFYNEARGKKKAVEISKALFEFLCVMGVPGTIENQVEKFKNQGELSFADEYGKVWNLLVDALEQISEVMGDNLMTLEEFTDVFTIGLNEYKIGLIPPSIDQVSVTSVERLKSHEVKALYLLGVNDGIFPVGAKEEGILSDSEREALKTLGLELAPNTRETLFEEHYTVYSTFSMPSHILKISYPIADHEGRTMRMSQVIQVIKKIFPNIKEDSNIISDESEEGQIKLVAGPVSTFNELIFAVKRKEITGEISDLWRDVKRWYLKDNKWRGMLNFALSARYYTNQVESLRPDKIKNIYGKQLNFSISRLEKFAQCPFAYYVQYGLKAKERRIYELSPPDIGTFLHTVLDRFAALIDKSNMSWRDLEKKWCEETISEIVDDTVNEASGSILSSSARYKYLKNRLKKIILRSVWLISMHIKKGNFEPKGHEIIFGQSKEYPPIILTLPSGEKVNLIGRIDRVDELETEEGIYVRIIDYKSGNKSFNLSDIYNGLELQLLIYLDALLEYESKKTGKKAFPGGILYFKIDDPMISTEGELSLEEIETEIMKRLKMKGLLLSDVRIIKQMDKDMDKSSLIIPAMIKADGTLSAASSSADAENFDDLRSHVRKLIISLCEDMLLGNITIKPYKKGKNTPCDFCSYKSICRFDVTIRANSYRVIKDKSRDEIWDALKQEGGGI
ncbi:ATP-dependent helicase/deoxyribonuclease subunit B [Oxobacter pfennigii]|uniref:ATP-dependent helicase/deoxyribonuclease subunit B n=1 Tax=Oxobacter pfennigii TaxID=36849 RepID=A0A0P8X3Q2_9CLOT|nr:helicase-exonuclease AddAB subunit AddB [Oxobacter pfennigii]KPU45426.1 ATP-dependent helicase/deoxyribonuclease subunit B [Oxobacter pfennigii]